MHEISIKIDKLLYFFDSDKSVRQHSNSIKALVGEELLLAIMIEFYRRRGVTAEVFSRQCTTGKRRGHQLDAWLRVEHNQPEGITYYQVEVKSWSGHGVGGASRYLRGDSNVEELASYKKQVWNLYWKEGRFVDRRLNKVLDVMKKPGDAGKVLPLACLWAPVHPDGRDEPLFSIELTDAPFDTVWVFSASSYLRQLCSGQSELVLSLPVLSERMSWLRELFTFSTEARHDAPSAHSTAAAFRDG